ncbi:MAG: hypothetical protein ACXVCP_10125 [Bdellovibrio sp.]
MKKLANYLKNFVLSLILIHVSTAYASTTYHIRVDGNDTSCNGSANAPSSMAPNCSFLTVQKGINTAQAGDTVSVHAGDYSSVGISSARSGSAGNQITIAAATGEQATLGTKIALSHNYIILKGFQLTNIPSDMTGLFAISGSYIEIRNNYIYSNNAANFENSVGMVLGGSNNIVDGNTFDGKSGGPYQNVPAIWIPINFAGSWHTVSHNVIKNISNPERVFEINNGSNNTISDNEVYNTWWNNVSGKTHADIFQSWIAGAGNNLIIERNYFHDIEGQIGVFGTGGSGPLYLRNNIFANITSSLFIGMSNVHIDNNIFYHVATSGDSIIYANDSKADISGFEFMNNALYATGAADATGRGYLSISAPGTTTIDYNFMADGSNQPKSIFSGKEAHGVNGGNPKFNAVYSDCVMNVCQFSIAVDSVLTGKGTPISGFSTDYLNNIRVTPWDIGAYKSGSTSNVLRAPLNLRIN